MPDDVDGVARVHTEAGRDAYATFLPPEVLSSPERLGRRVQLWTEVLARLGDRNDDGSVEGLWVAVDTDAPTDVVGFIHTDRSHDPDAGPDTGEITTFYVATGRQGEGIGERLLQRAVDHLHSCGCEDLRLWTLEGNTRAQAYYAERGWSPDGATRPVPSDYEATEIRLRTTRTALGT